MDININEEHLKNLKEWADGNNNLYVPEILAASTHYSGTIDDNLINRLLDRLYEVEKQPRIWLQYAHSLLPIYKKVGNNASKLKFLEYIYRHNEEIAVCWQTNCNPVIKETGTFFRAELPEKIKDILEGK